MSKLIRRWIPSLIFATIPGLTVLAGYLTQNPVLVYLRDRLIEGAVIVAAFAFLLGAFNILHVHGGKVRHREQGWPYSVLLLLALIAGLVPAVLQILPGDSPIQAMFGDAAYALFNHVIRPVEASLAALVVFTLGLAAFRLMRVRGGLGTVLFLAIACVVLLGTAPLSGLEWLVGIRDWIINVPGMAGMRGLLLGVALGTVITGLRVLLTSRGPHSEL